MKMQKNMGSKRWHLNKIDLINIGKVLAWTIASSLVVALIDTNAALQYPEGLLILQPIINTLLVAAYKFTKDNH